MSWGAAAWLMLGGSTVLLFLGLPVAFSFLVINLAGALLFLGGEAGLTQLARNSVVSVASFSLTPIPLFILMGEGLFHTGLAVKVIHGVERLARPRPRRPGGGRGGRCRGCRSSSSSSPPCPRAGRRRPSRRRSARSSPWCWPSRTARSASRISSRHCGERPPSPA